MIPPIYVTPDDPDFLRILNARLAMIDGAAPAATEEATVTTLSGTHKQRLATYPATAYADGAVFYEDDRTVLYVVVASGSSRKWRYVIGTMTGATADKPADLGTDDAGFLFKDTTLSKTEQWSGSAWVTAGISASRTFVISATPILTTLNYKDHAGNNQVMNVVTAVSVFTQVNGFTHGSLTS
jgi:hypothetical protein